MKTYKNLYPKIYEFPNLLTAWKNARRGQRYKPSVAAFERNLDVELTTLQALREVGVLDEITQTEAGVVTYPGAMVRESSYRTVGINGVWLNVYNRWAEANGQARAEKATDVPRDRAKWAKGQVGQWAQSGEKLQLQVREETIDVQPRKVAYHPDGTRFGTIDRGSTADVGDTVTVQFALSHDGNLRVVTED